MTLEDSPDCVSCLNLKKKITELETRISVLYQIYDEQNIQTASSKDTGPAQTSTTPRNSPGINHLVGEAVKAHELSNMDCQPEKQQ
ncbi:unnamed protein product [Arctogadus glacialis]